MGSSLKSGIILYNLRKLRGRNMKKIIKPLIALGAFTASIFVAMPIADAVQNDFGNVEVSLGHFEDSETRF